MRAFTLLHLPIFVAKCLAISHPAHSRSGLEKRGVKLWNKDTPGAIKYTVGPDQDVCDASVPLSGDTACVALRSLEWLLWAMGEPTHSIHKESPKEIFAERHKGQQGNFPVRIAQVISRFIRYTDLMHRF